MDINLPQNDPIASYQRKAKAARRAGKCNKCGCGEARPEALIPGSNPTTCAACEREKHKETTMDDHHVAGKANNPATIPVSVNDHRAELNRAQQDWQKMTLENPDGSPLLAAAASVRGFVDTVVYLIKKFLLWIPEMLEKLNEILVKTLGPKFWLNTELEQFFPRS